MAGLSRYQSAPRHAPRLTRPAAFAHERVRLLDYGGIGPIVVVVPSLINPPFVLDLAEDNSLMGWLAAQGLRPLLLDWGEPMPHERDRDVAGHVEELLLPLLRTIGESVHLAGYCLGGTMALAAAMLHPVESLTLIAAPWRFSRFGPRSRAEIAGLWEAAEPSCRAMGLVPMEVLQNGFWRLDPERTIRKFERLGGLPDGADIASFVALEDWANAGAPLTYAAGRELFGFFAGDPTGRREWRVGGQRVDPADLQCRAIDFVSLTDRIVPAASASGIADRRELSAGHVGMVIGSRAREQLWEPFASFLRAG